MTQHRIYYPKNFEIIIFYTLKNIKFSKKKILWRVTVLKYLVNLSCISRQFRKEVRKYFIFSDKVSNNTYNIEKSKINILMKNGNIVDITTASDQFNIDALNRKVEKYFLCYPQSIIQ